MRPARSRRVQAQRKFAQGAYVPPNAVAVVASDNRRDAAQNSKNVTINHMTATGLLDVVSLQSAASMPDRLGLHSHLTSQPVVLIERLRGKNSSRDGPRSSQRETIQARPTSTLLKLSTCHRECVNGNVSTIKKPAEPPKLHCIKKKKEYKREHCMSLRSRRLSKLELNKIIAESCTPLRKKAAKRTIEKDAKKRKKRSRYSLEDCTPLKYLADANASSTPKKSARIPDVPDVPGTRAVPAKKNFSDVQAAPEGPITPGVPAIPGVPVTREVPDILLSPQLSLGSIISDNLEGLDPGIPFENDELVFPIPHISLMSPEPVAGPSGLQINIEDSDDSKSDDFKLYYGENELLYCVAEKWRSVQDVINAPKEEVDSRCKLCKPCIRIEKLMKISALLRTQVQVGLTGDNNNDAVEKAENEDREEVDLEHDDVEMENRNTTAREDEDQGHLYLDLLPKHPSFMMKLRIHMVHGKELLSACLIPRSRSQKNNREFLLQEHEHLLDQLIETLTLSLKDNTDVELEGRRISISSINSTETAINGYVEMEANRRMMAEVDGMARILEKEKDAKLMDPGQSSNSEMKPSTSNFRQAPEGGKLVDAPVYRPTKEEFKDPLVFYEKIWPEAVKYGICKVVPPEGWKPPSKVPDDIRFYAMNQYISRLFSRWGPAARELCAIKLCLQQQKNNNNLTRLPLLDGVEVNLPKLYHLVQRHGGLEAVINKNRWGKVAEDMKFSKVLNIEKKLDHIYVKYLLPYDTLSHQERQETMRIVEKSWNRKNQQLLDRAMNPLHRQKRMLGLSDSSDDETEDEDTAKAVKEAEDCIMKGPLMNCGKFKKLATNAYENMFGHASETSPADPPSLTNIEEHYWRLVTLGTEHLCVHTAAIDTGEEGYGFTRNKNCHYGNHAWNPKMISQHPRNVLRYLGAVLGMTVPTLLLGMLFSTSCWHKDPHALPWLEYQLCGPTRIWYGIPSDQADNFRKAVETLCPTSCQNKGLWLPSDISMIPPQVLREHNVSLSRVTQEEREYILAFPNAYTCCICTGYTESESVYFAPTSWLESLSQVFKDARESCEPTMFSMEHLLFVMGKDQKIEASLLRIVQPMYDKMLREEVTNRQMLQERGLAFIHESVTSRRKNTPNVYNARDQDECEYCRATLFLSKVKGVTSKNSLLCLEHALKLLDNNKYKKKAVSQLEVIVNVSVKELNTVGDDMKRRMGIS